MHSLEETQVVGVLSRRVGASLGLVPLLLTILLAHDLNVRALGEGSPIILGRPALPLALGMAPPAGSTNYFVVIVMEDKNYGDVIGNWSSAPYINRLGSDYGIAANYFQVSLNQSLPNYLGLEAGQTYSPWSSCNQPPTSCTGWSPVVDLTIVDRLEASGLTWKAYMEDMPSNCYKYNSGKYVPSHNPFVYFAKVSTIPSECAKVQQAGAQASKLVSDLASPSTASNLMWLTPNLCDDMHDCSVSTGDNYLSNLIPQILNSQVFHTQNAALFLTWDEGRTSTHIPAIWAGPSIRNNYKSTTRFDHYSFLKTLETVWHLPPETSNDQAASPMTDFFTTKSQLTYTPGAPLAQQNISFTGTVLKGLAPFSYSWTFGDAGTATGETVVHSYSQTGKYEVALTTTDALNHTATTTAILTPSVESQSPSVAGLVGMVSAGFLLATLAPTVFGKIRANKRRAES